MNEEEKKLAVSEEKKHTEDGPGFEAVTVVIMSDDADHARLMELSVRLCDYAEKTGHGQQLRNVLPVLCYDKLICKGIRYDPSVKDVREAMAHYRNNATMQKILKGLLAPMPLLSYTVHTGKGFATQIRGRLFASRWLSGNLDGAMALIEGRIGK